MVQYNMIIHNTWHWRTEETRLAKFAKDTPWLVLTASLSDIFWVHFGENSPWWYLCMMWKVEHYIWVLPVTQSTNRACHTGSHYWDYYPGALSWYQVIETCLKIGFNIDRLVQERHNSIANALELCLSCTNPLRYWGLSQYKDVVLPV